MEKKVFETIMRGNHELSNRDYILGFVRGIGSIICNEQLKKSFTTYINTNGLWVIPIECTKEEYEAFTKIVEKRYPGLFVFEKIED
jgi:hypothetical protein